MAADRTSSSQGGGTSFDRDTSSNGRSEATPQKSISDSEFDKAYSSGRPPWDIGQPQPAFGSTAVCCTSSQMQIGCAWWRAFKLSCGLGGISTCWPSMSTPPGLAPVG